MTEQGFDVFIYELATGRVDRIVGERMRYSGGGGETAEKRADTVGPRLNDRYSVVIVPTGLYHEGDVLAPEHGHRNP